MRSLLLLSSSAGIVYIRALGLDLVVKNKYLKTRKITFENKQKAKMCSSEYILVYTIYVCRYICM
jgi:hypothetical protein